MPRRLPAGTTALRNDGAAPETRLPLTRATVESAGGRVVAVRGEVATVAVDAGFACPRCAAGEGCGAGLFGAGGQRRIDVHVPAGTRLHEGATVRLVVSPRRLLAAATLAYGLPLAGFVLATAAGWLLGGSDGTAALAGLGGLAAALWAGRRQLASSAACAAYVPVLEPGRG